MKIQDDQANHEVNKIKRYGYETLMLSENEKSKNEKSNEQKINLENPEFSMSSCCVRCYCDGND